MVEADGGLGAGGALVALPYLLEQSKTKYACDRRRDGIGVRPAFLSSPPAGKRALLSLAIELPRHGARGRW